MQKINTTPTSMKPSNKSLVRSFLMLASAMTSVVFTMTSGYAASYSSTVLADNPIAYYRLEETSGGTAANSAITGISFDGTIFPNSGSPQLGLPGIDTNSFSFAGGPAGGNIGLVNIPYQPDLSPVAVDGQSGAAFSAECWAQPFSQPNDHSSVVEVFGPYGSGTYQSASGWNFYQSPGPSSYWVLNMRPAPFVQVPSVPITLLQWYHLAVTFDGVNVIFYIDGVARTTNNAVGYLANLATPGDIGGGQVAGHAAFAGGVDEVAFYTNVLTPAQILNHYQVGTNSFRVAPVAFLSQPASATVYSGTTAKFSVLVSGSGLHYQWKRGSTAISGATGSSYSFVCSYPADDGATFSVNINGTTNSDTATLTVSPDLVISNNPYGPITRYVGSKAAFRVAAVGALPITYQWYKNDITPIPAATNDTLWLSTVQLADDGSTYSAHVTGPFFSSNTPPVTLQVSNRPVTVPLTGYARFVAGDDAVAYWRLDEAGGTAFDAIGSFDGIYGPAQIAPAPVFIFQVPDGISHETNPAVHITGGAVVTIPYALELNPVSGPWSAELWVSPSSTDGANFRSVFSALDNRFGGQHDYGWNIYQYADPGGYWTLNMYNGAGSGTFASDFTHHPFVLNSWYHMVIADDLTTIRYYVNNLLVVTLDRKANFIPNGINGDPAIAGAPTVIGQRYDSGFDAFDGAIDDAAIYNYALSAAQIQNHFLNNTKITINKAANNVVLTWAGSGLALQSSPNVYGSNLVDVAGATSPYTNAVGSSAKFFRLRLQ
jgi:Concanavalin A-like lectin/glucanases superfamily